MPWLFFWPKPYGHCWWPFSSESHALFFCAASSAGRFSTYYLNSFRDITLQCNIIYYPLVNCQLFFVFSSHRPRSFPRVFAISFVGILFFLFKTFKFTVKEIPSVRFLLVVISQKICYNGTDSLLFEVSTTYENHPLRLTQWVFNRCAKKLAGFLPIFDRFRRALKDQTRPGEKE